MCVFSLFGDSQNDPTNAVDDVESYGILNLYLGVRHPDRNWDVSLYGKNITDAERVLTRSSTPLTTNYNQLATALTGITTYRQINFTARVSSVSTCATRSDPAEPAA